MIQSNDGGANVSHNGGLTWTDNSINRLLNFIKWRWMTNFPYWLYAGQQDNYTTIAVPSLPPHSHQAGALGFMVNTGGCETKSSCSQTRQS
ncbi:MAG: hypothetical protein R2788_14490 [Saprospiraceae bacterium]